MSMRALALAACLALAAGVRPVPDSCQGTILPYFDDNFETNIGYFILYLILMAYFFVGVAVTADLFMNSIEIITSKTKHITLPSGGTMDVKVWNETVANLTLMALGSSAPEILLSIVEVVGRGFEAGELGPGTIVGSAAFNMLMIIAYCMTSVKPLRVQSIYVLHFTAASSIFAYIWLYVIVSGTSPGQIDVWEAVVTILFFPLFVFVAWLFDTGRLKSSADYVAFRLPVQRDHKRIANRASTVLESEIKQEHSHVTQVNEIRVPWRRKRRLQKIIAKLRKEDPNADESELIERAITQLKERHPLVTAGRGADEQTTVKGLFGFASSHTVANVAKTQIVRLKIQREHFAADPTLANACSLSLVVTNETAVEGVHFKLPKINQFAFPANQPTTHTVELDLVRQPEFQGKRSFEVTLEVDGHHHCHWKHRTCQVTINDELRATSWFGRLGERLRWSFGAVTSPEPVDNAWLEQIRQSFYPDDDDDDDDDDDQDRNGIQLDASASYESHPADDTRLTIVRGQSNHFDVGGTDVDEVLSDISLSTGSNPNELSDISITDSDHTQLDQTGGRKSPRGSAQSTDRLMSARQSVGASLVDAEPTSLASRIGFYLQLPWVLLFNIVTPPPQYLGGWLAFVFSLAYIGVLTAFVGDLATGLGCTVGLKDAVTAISLVALGTSVPDTLASKIAAENDGADPAIGNVTGSNAVNVFLGVGLSWLAGAAYHSSNGTTFVVPEGTIAFSVVLFSIFAIVWYATLMYRRSTSAIGAGYSSHPENGEGNADNSDAKPQGAELGGAEPYRTMTVVLFVVMWFTYILLSALVAYGDVQGF
eukprot:TRINITY_DN12057_c3_g1_i7.p1 TRINITY_DN12057_c3_g1~~TRINITY_DN12057_c3_g1_i7.p1  ORF type:complete len:823 (+),score=170.56 TRINITY_DN12057_c3_g1_i7:50-2518(+)